VILDILQYPDPKLREISVPVVGPLGAIVEDMFETMYAATGRGLAAPQIGVLERFFVIDTTWKEGDMTPMVFINPMIAAFGDSQTNEEACLSIAHQSRKVTRPGWVDVIWTALDGAQKTGRFETFAAACICHELDHLDGKLILDYPAAS